MQQAVLLRHLPERPELAPELNNVVNALDAWPRDRGEHVGIAWEPRKGAETDEAFNEP